MRPPRVLPTVRAPLDEALSELLVDRNLSLGAVERPVWNVLRLSVGEGREKLRSVEKLIPIEITVAGSRTDYVDDAALDDALYDAAVLVFNKRWPPEPSYTEDLEALDTIEARRERTLFAVGCEIHVGRDSHPRFVGLAIHPLGGGSVSTSIPLGDARRLAALLLREVETIEQEQREGRR